jgi:anthranilate phosphoribosyltransferase
MLDIRIGVAIEAEVDKQLLEICKRNATENKSLSKGDFLMAMVTMLSPEVQDQTIAAYRAKREGEKEQKKAVKKELTKKLKSLTPEEIEAVLAARKAA